MLKKISLAVIGLTLGSVVNAGTMGPACTPGAVTVPCVWQGWDLGVEGLYLKPAYTGSNAYTYTNDNGTNLRNFVNDWDWGYRLQGSYHFNTGNDLTLDWLHFNDTVSGRGISAYSLGNQSGLFRNSAQYTNQLDQVNLVLGQHTDLGLKKKLRFYGGLQYAHLVANTLFVFGPPEINPTVSAPINRDFKGLGPVLGIDYSYNLTTSFSVTANSEGSMLIGRSRDYEAYIIGPLVARGLSARNRAIVPTLQARVGFNYAQPFAEGVLNFKVGYQALNYFNVMHNIDQLSFSSRTLQTSSFGLYGPYLGLHYAAKA